MNLRRCFIEKKQAATGQDDIPPGDRLAEKIEQGAGQADDPGDGRQQGQAADQRQDETKLPRPVLPFRRQSAGKNGNEHQVIDAKNDFEGRKSRQACPNLRIDQPIHDLLRCSE